MRRNIKILIIICLFLMMVFGVLFGCQLYFEKELEKKYNSIVDKIICGNLSTEKFQGMYFQKKNINNKDMILYGSSELSTDFIPEHPNNFYKNKNNNYNISLIGRGHCQDIIHAINIGSLKPLNSDKKMGIIISPQWFTKDGLTLNGFAANFSELQFYNFMDNDQISKDIKLKICKRVSNLLKKSSDMNNIILYSELYLKDNFISKVGLSVLKPYYYIKKELLYTLDLKQSLDIINDLKYDSNLKDNSKENKKVDWNSAIKEAERHGDEKCTNNEYGIYDAYFNKYIKNNYEKLKGANESVRYNDSPEYEDLKLLIEICKEKGIEPLLILAPVHGKWYDYTGFKKEHREEFYKKIKEIASNDKMKILDLSEYEYEKYFLCDTMHLGWKGWIRLNEGIDRYYNENQK